MSTDAMTRPACPRCGEMLVAGECVQHGPVGTAVETLPTEELEPSFDEPSVPAEEPATPEPPRTRADAPIPVPAVVPKPVAAAEPAAPPTKWQDRAPQQPAEPALPPLEPPSRPPTQRAPITPTPEAGLIEPMLASIRKLGPAKLAAAVGGLIVLILLFSIWRGEADLNSRLDALSASSRALEERLNDSVKSADALNKRIAKVEKKVGEQVDFKALARRVLPSVFTIEAGQSLGSGFVVQSSGGRSLLVTNAHVISDVGEGGRVTVKQRDRSDARGTVRSVDVENDLAIIAVSRRYPALRRATRSPGPGTQVIVVGSPLGLGGTVTDGLISGRQQGLLQFSAPINFGNSGGPVVDTSGRVVGVAVLKIVGFGAEGLSFAVPISELCSSLIEC